MNSRTIICIDTLEKAHIIDVRSEEELEVIITFIKNINLYISNSNIHVSIFVVNMGDLLVNAD